MWATDQMRPLLFHRLLSQHPVLPTPEGSSRLHFRVFAASLAFAMRDRLGSLLFPIRGQHVGAPRFTLCCGLLFCTPFSGGYKASAHSVTPMHRLPASWSPDLYQNWTFTSEQTMTFQDTPRCVRRGYFEITTPPGVSASKKMALAID